MYVKFEYTNEVIGNGKSNNIQYNKQQKKDIKTKYNSQHTEHN